MQETKKPLRTALNLRIDDGLAAEIERIAGRTGSNDSETARRLLAYGVEVDRRLEAQRLSRNYNDQYEPDTAGRVVISAEFVPYTWAEAGEIADRLANTRTGSPEPRHPTWEDCLP